MNTLAASMTTAAKCKKILRTAKLMRKWEQRATNARLTLAALEQQVAHGKLKRTAQARTANIARTAEIKALEYKKRLLEH